MCKACTPLSPGELATADQNFQEAKNFNTSVFRIVKGIKNDNPDWTPLDVAMFLQETLLEELTSGQMSIALATLYLRVVDSDS